MLPNSRALSRWSGTQGLTGLLVGLQALLTLALLGGAFGHVWNLRAEALAHHRMTAEAQARMFEDHLTQSLSVVGMTLAAATSFAALPDLPGRSASSALNDALAERLRGLSLVRSLSVLGEDGSVLASSNPDNLVLQPAQRQLLAGVVAVAAGAGELPVLTGLRAGRDLADARPVSAERPVPPDALSFVSMVRGEATSKGRLVGVAVINTDYFINHIERHIDPAITSVDVLDYDGTVLWSTRPSQVLGKELSDAASLAAMREQEIGTLGEHEMAGRAMLGAYRASRNFPCFVVVDVDREAALDSWYEEAVDTLLVAFLAAVALLLLSSLLIARLRAGVRKEARLAAELHLAASVFEHSTDGILITDARCNILAVNPAFEKITGYSASELLGANPRIFSSGRHDADFYRRMWESIKGDGL